MLLTFGGAAVVVGVEFDPADAPRLVAVFPPWWSREQALAAASQTAPVAGVGAAGFVVFVVAVRRDVARALRRRGALFVGDGRAFPACFSSTEPE